MPVGVIESAEKYRSLLRENSLFDYTAMIRSAVDYIEGDPYEDDDFARVQDHIRDDIRYVVVDEYQDVNPLQERLVRGLVQFGANLCVVGDDDQTIYQWRGSQVSNIISLRAGIPASDRSPSTTTSGRARGSSRSADPSRSGSPTASDCRRRWSPPATRRGSAATCSL